METYFSSGLYVFETKEECEEINNLISEWEEYADNRDYGSDYYLSRNDKIGSGEHLVESAYIRHLMTKETPKQIIILFQDEHYQHLKDADEEKELGETSLWKLVVNKLNGNLCLYYKEPIVKYTEKTSVKNLMAFYPGWINVEIPIKAKASINDGVSALDFMMEVFKSFYEENNKEWDILESIK